MFLNRDRILSADDLPREVVEVPEWGGSVYVRTMTGAERDRFEDEHHKQVNRNFRARLAVLTVCDEAGVLLFKPEDAGALGEKSAAALNRVLDVSAKLNGLTKSDVDDLEKN